MITRPPLRLLVIGWAALPLSVPAGAARARGRPGGRGGGEEASVTPHFPGHGGAGAGASAGAFPGPTGHAACDIDKRLVDAASRAGPDEVMTPIAGRTSEPQTADVACCHSVVDAPFAPPPEVEPEVLARGRAIAAAGLPEHGARACNPCHDADGSGNPPLLPHLAGQNAPYTSLQLELWRRDERRNDALDVMRDIAKVRAAEDLRALALYDTTLRPEAGGSGTRVGARADRASGG